MTLTFKELMDFWKRQISKPVRITECDKKWSCAVKDEENDQGDKELSKQAEKHLPGTEEWHNMSLGEL